MQKIILATMVLMLLSSVVYGADWQCVGIDANGTLWIYDTQNISYGQDTTKVWGKRILGDKCKKENIKDCPITLDIEKVSYIKDKFEINWTAPRRLDNSG